MAERGSGACKRSYSKASQTSTAWIEVSGNTWTFPPPDHKDYLAGLARDVTKASFVEMCSALAACLDLPAGSVRPLTITEGGWEFNYPGGHKRTIRFYDRPLEEWPTVSDDTLREWEGCSDVLFSCKETRNMCDDSVGIQFRDGRWPDVDIAKVKDCLRGFGLAFDEDPFWIYKYGRDKMEIRRRLALGDPTAVDNVDEWYESCVWSWGH